jgi:hypothetical protein
LKGLRLMAFAQYNAKSPPPSVTKPAVSGGDTTLVRWDFPVSAADNNNVWFGLMPCFKNDRLSVGFEFDKRRDKHPVPVASPTAPVDPIGLIEVTTTTSQYVGGFLTFEFVPAYRAILRLDQFDPNTDKERDSDVSTTLIAGLAHTYAKGVRSLVSVEYTKFQEPSLVKLDADVTVAASLELTL